METLEHIFDIRELVLGFENPLHSTALNLTLPLGKLIAVLGKNGSGKSTLLSVLCGGNGRLSGNTYIAGERTPVHQLSSKQLAQRIAYVPQEHEYSAHFRGVDLLGMALLHKIGIWKKLPDKHHPKIQTLARRLRLEELLEKNLNRMSSGERQRLFLARALLQQPKVLLLDEPTNHLDPSGIDEFWQILVGAVRHEKLSVIMSTHDLSFVERYAEEILALDKSGIFFQGTNENYMKQKVGVQLFKLKSPSHRS